MASERKVTVQRSEANMIDQDFSAIRTRFEDEMKKMEDEMNRFRSHLMDREVGFFGPTSNTTKHSSSLTSSNDHIQRSTSPNWVENINSPLVHDTDDGKVLRLKFDVTQYAPEEIVVKTIDNRLQVHAKHEEKDAERSVFREYNREFLLPKGTNPEQIRSSLSKDGVLTVEAPLPAAITYKDGDRKIPIQHK